MTSEPSPTLIGPTVHDVLRFLARGAVPALMTGALVATLAWTLVQRQTPLYRASATVLATARPASGGSIGLPSPAALDALGYRTALLSDAVVGAALADLGIVDPRPEDLVRFRNQIAVDAEETRDTSVLHIRVEDASAARAAAGATALAAALSAWDDERANLGLTAVVARLRNEIAALDARIASFVEDGVSMSRQEFEGVQSLRMQRQSDLLSAQALLGSGAATLQLTRPAVPPSTPVSPRPNLALLAGFALGALAAYLVSALRLVTDGRLRTAEALPAQLGAAPLVKLPRLPNGQWEIPQRHASRLRAVVCARLECRPGRSRVVLVVSSREQEEQDAIAASLAKSFVYSGARTLLIDADLHATRIADRLKLGPADYGDFATFLRHPEMVHSEAQHHRLGAPMVVPNFNTVARSADLLSQGFADCLAVWRQRYDALVISAAPVLEVADAQVLAPHCDLTLLTARVGRSRTEDLREARELLARDTAGRVEVVATDVPMRERRSGPYGAAVRARPGRRGGTPPIVLEPTDDRIV